MDDIQPLRTDGTDRLEKEIESLAVLRDSLGRSDTMTQNMLGILTSFESRLSKLEETIIPIYQETGNLQRRHENIDKTLSSLDNVLGFYHVVEEVDPIIRDGPGPDLQQYLECMEKLQKAVDYFTKNNADSPEMSHVITLYDIGKDSLEREFRNILTRYSCHVPPILILDVLAGEEDEEPPVLEHLPQKVLENLKRLSNWLQNCGHPTNYMQVYSTIRSSIIIKSLQHLRDHLKTGSGGSGNIVVSHSPAMTSKFRNKEHSSKKALKRMAFVRKASTALKKSMAPLEAAGLIKPGHSSSDPKDEGIYIDIDYYITSVHALLKLIQSEWTLMQGLIPDKHQRKIFESLMQASLDMVIKEGEQISLHIKRSMGRHQTPAVISIFPVLKHLRAIKPQFDVTMEGCQAPTRNKLPTLISNLDTTGAKSLEEFVETIRNDPDKSSNMPKDGTVHELTSNTMIFLEQLLEFSDTAGAMLLTQDPTSLPNVKNLDRQRLKLAEFITKVLSSLGLNLNNKSETYSDSTLRSVFMLNNYNYMLKSLRKSGMMELVHMWNNEVASFYDDQVLNQKRIYSQRHGVLEIVHVVKPELENVYVQQVTQYRNLYRNSWSRVLQYIAENQKPAGGPVSSDTKLKDKERQAIKDKFSGFNREIEEIFRIQKGYAIPDLDLRASLKKDNNTYIIPFYKAFLQKYQKCHFTKNPEKYIKYSGDDVQRYLNRLFDSTA